MTHPNPRMHGQQFGKELCEALGLDSHLVSSITIHTKATKAATVEVLMHIGVDEAQKVYRLLANYVLVIKREEEWVIADSADGELVVKGRA